jgi:hypothetical protein
MRSGLAVCVIFLPSLAIAGGADLVDGTWEGKGSFQLGGDVLNCSAIKMQFEGASTKFVVRDASMTCGEGPEQKFPQNDPFEVTQGGEVVHKGVKAGSIAGNTMTTAGPVENGAVEHHQYDRVGDLLFYMEYTGVPGQTPQYSMVAVLHRK